MIKFKQINYDNYLYKNYLYKMPKLSKVFIFLLGILYIKNADPGTNVGAYLTTPDPSLLEYRLGNGLGYIGNRWDDAKMANLRTLAGYDGQRKNCLNNILKIGDLELN